MFHVLVVEFYFHFVVWCIIKSTTRHIKLIFCVASNVLLILFLLLFACLKLGLGFNFGSPQSFSIWIFFVLICVHPFNFERRGIIVFLASFDHLAYDLSNVVA